MIVAKPKISTLFSLGTFLVMAYGFSIYFFIQILHNPLVSKWVVVGLGVFGGAAIAVTIKTVTGYKNILVSKNKIEVQYAFKLVRQKYFFKEMEDWKEITVKTVSGVFKELEISFGNKRKVKLTYQEHSNYDNVKAFMLRHFKKKMVKA